MEYGKIIAVTGLPGLFELITSKNDGAIVRSLEDKSTKFVSSRVHNFSHLESIEVYTVRENVNLVDIFNAIEKDGGKVPDGKDASQLKKYFEKIYPDIDFERVYTSDLKKMVKWFDVLKANNIEIKLTEKEEEEAEEAADSTGSSEEPAEEAKVEKKGAKAAAPAKKTKAEGDIEAENAEEKPKKTASKKKADSGKSSSVEEKEKPTKAPAKKSAPKKK